MESVAGEKQIGKIDVQRRSLRIEDLSDRVKLAIDLFNSAQRRFERGEDSLREWENIIRVLNAEIKNIERFIAIAYHNMGVIYAQRKNLQEAKKLFEKALKIDSEYAIAYYNLAVVHKKLGNLVKARSLYKKALSLGYSPK